MCYKEIIWKVSELKKSQVEFRAKFKDVTTEEGDQPGKDKNMRAGIGVKKKETLQQQQQTWKDTKMYRWREVREKKWTNTASN